MLSELYVCLLFVIYVGDSHNDGEKTFAIVAGLLAGIALVIIFLTFVRKVAGGHGINFLFITFLFFHLLHINFNFITMCISIQNTTNLFLLTFLQVNKFQKRNAKNCTPSSSRPPTYIDLLFYVVLYIFCPFLSFGLFMSILLFPFSFALFFY